MGIGARRTTAEQRRLRRLRERLREAQGNRCHFCGVEMTSAEQPFQRPTDCTLEHLIPRSHGGPLSAANCVAACHACNNGRNRALQLRGAA